MLNEAATVSMTQGLQNIVEASTSVMTTITSNELLMTLFCGSIVGVACMFIRKVKKTAKA